LISSLGEVVMKAVMVQKLHDYRSQGGKKRNLGNAIYEINFKVSMSIVKITVSG